MTLKNHHISIMTKEILEFLKPQEAGVYLDATLGDGGHTKRILETGATVISIDQDQEAIKRSQEVLSEFNPVIADQSTTSKSILIKTNFENLEDKFEQYNLPKLDGALFDLGASTYQLLSEDRGFSFQADSPLDMRMDKDLAVKASDILKAFSQKELENLFRELGGEERARAISKAIKMNIPQTTSELADLIERIKPQTGRLHPATKVFQSLRMAVNQERHSLKTVLPQVVRLLKPGARLVILSFHQGEDAIVKNFFKELDGKSLNVLTKKPLIPSESELTTNPRSRSTKMRVAEKI